VKQTTKHNLEFKQNTLTSIPFAFQNYKNRGGPLLQYSSILQGTEGQFDERAIHWAIAQWIGEDISMKSESLLDWFALGYEYFVAHVQYPVFLVIHAAY
jgi:hypothetical protein